MAVNQVAVTEGYLSSRQKEEPDTHIQETCIINLEPYDFKLSKKSSRSGNLGEILIFESDGQFSVVRWICELSKKTESSLSDLKVQILNSGSDVIDTFLEIYFE